MNAHIRPPFVGGPRSLAPELARIIDALARVQEERDHTAARGFPAAVSLGVAAGEQAYDEPDNT